MLAIGVYYIDRSYKHVPCWDIATSKKEAIVKAKKWSTQDQCICSISEGDKKILYTDMTGNVYKNLQNAKCEKPIKVTFPRLLKGFYAL